MSPRSPGGLALGLPDAWLSSRHARLRPILHRWAIEDLGSRNGTFVNGARVREMMLADGDVIELGHSFLVFRLAPPDAGPTTSRPAPSTEDRPGWPPCRRRWPADWNSSSGWRPPCSRS